MEALLRKLLLFLMLTLLIGGKTWEFPRGFKVALEQVRQEERRVERGGRARFLHRSPRSE
jgi:hypothetical protein